MATRANMRALVLLLVFISLHLQSHADFIQLPALKASISGSRVALSSVKAVAPTNWKFSRWQKGLAIYSTANPLVVANVTSNMTLSANFARANAATDWACYK